MSKTSPTDNPVLRWSFSGTVHGPVKQLSGFRKGVHTTPDRHSPALEAFVTRIAAEDLANQAESFYQLTRTQYGYRRKEIQLTVGSPIAILETPAFHLEISFRPDPDDPARYERSIRLSGLAPEHLDSPATDTVFGGVFDSLEILVSVPVPVESLIDAVEDDPAAIWSVDYPSSCDWCRLSSTQIPGALIVSANCIQIRTASAGPPSTLLDAYIRIGDALSAATGSNPLPTPLAFSRHGP